MKTLNKFLNELAPIGKLKRPTPVVATDSTIHKLVREGIERYGKNADLNYIDVSQVTNMESLFEDTDFDGNVSKWNVSNVETMNNMFRGCEKFNPFNQDLSGGKVDRVTDMSYMFFNCENFNQPLNNWNVSNVTDMKKMFYKCKNFDQPLNNWIVSNVTDMEDMFYKCENFNKPLNNGNVEKVTDMCDMFYGCENFNGDLNNGTVKITDKLKMSGMFSGSPLENNPPSGYLT